MPTLFDPIKLSHRFHERRMTRCIYQTTQSRVAINSSQMQAGILQGTNCGSLVLKKRALSILDRRPRLVCFKPV